MINLKIFQIKKINETGNYLYSNDDIKEKQLLKFEENLIKSQTFKNNDEFRKVKAGCFFELLVLRTHSVINIKNIQGAYSDIAISNGPEWTDEPIVNLILKDEKPTPAQPIKNK